MNSILNKKVISKVLNDKLIENKFLKYYKKWLLSSKLNKLKGLGNYKYLNYANGSSQIFDYFYAKNKSRRFRAFKESMHIISPLGEIILKIGNI